MNVEGTESAPWLRAFPRAAVRLCPLEACGLSALDCRRLLFGVAHFWRLPYWFCAVHSTPLPLPLGAVSVVPPAPALPSERFLRDQIRPCGGALFSVVAASATVVTAVCLWLYVSPQSFRMWKGWWGGACKVSSRLGLHPGAASLLPHRFWERNTDAHAVPKRRPISRLRGR